MEKSFIKNKDTDFKEIARKFDLNPVVSKILVNRDLTEQRDINNFLYGSLDDLYDPASLLGVVEGSKIITNKINEGKKIRIVGDYDVDGIMSVLILYKGLSRLGARVDYTIPDRVMDGYGINDDLVRKAKEDGIDTIITCDNGISAIDTVALAKELDLTIIITDHHDLPFIEEDGIKSYIYPEADTIINPKHPACSYPFKYLCGAAVAFKLIDYLYKIESIPQEERRELIEYVALATVCDVVDLVDENRIFVKYGLELLNNTQNIGLRALIEESRINGNLTGYHIGFVIGPTLNASGRLETAEKGLALLLEEDMDRASEMARELRAINEERKAITEEGLERVVDQIEGSDLINDKILLVYEPSIHESVAGIIAGRVKDIYNKPTFVLTDGREGVKGSGRSIEEYNMFEELTEGKDILKRFGGHPMAAGLSLDKENINNLRQILNNNTELSENDLIRKIYIDMALPIEYISYKQIGDLEVLEPFGKANPKPIFGDRKLTISKAFKLGANKNVLKLILKSSRGVSIEAMLFKEIEKFEEAIERKYGREALDDLYEGRINNITIDILYYPSINEYMGRKTLQVIIQGYRV